MLLCKLKSINNNSSYFFQKWKKYEELEKLYKRLYMEEVANCSNNWVQVTEYLKDMEDVPSDDISFKNCKGYFCDQYGRRLKAIPLYFHSREIKEYKKIQK